MVSSKPFLKFFLTLFLRPKDEKFSDIWADFRLARSFLTQKNTFLAVESTNANKHTLNTIEVHLNFISTIFVGQMRDNLNLCHI